MGTLARQWFMNQKVGRLGKISQIPSRKAGRGGITTAAPYVTG
jgi:hypothetical protein